MPDLIDRLAEAATNVIENERPGLSYDPQHIKSVVIELDVSSGGVHDARVYLERRGRLLRRADKEWFMSTIVNDLATRGARSRRAESSSWRLAPSWPSERAEGTPQLVRSWPRSRPP